MLVRNIYSQEIRDILKKQGLTSDVGQRGKDWHIRPKRLKKAVRIVPMGNNYAFGGYTIEKRKATAHWSNVHMNYQHNTTCSNTTTLGNADWYDLIEALLEAGATVKVVSDKFERLTDYDNWCENNNYQDLIDAERDMRYELTEGVTA